MAVEKHMRFVLGLDLGRKSTYAALCLMAISRAYAGRKEQYQRKQEAIIDEHYAKDPDRAWYLIDRLHRHEKPRPGFVITHLERVPLGTKYRKIARYVRTMLEDERVADRSSLVVDAGGPGDVVAEELYDVGIEDFTRVITNQHPGKNNTAFTRVVAKATLIGNLQVGFQNELIRFNPDVPYADAFERELSAFHYHTTAFGNETYKTASGEYDDLLSSAALANYLFLDLEGTPDPESDEGLAGFDKDLPFEPLRDGEFFRYKDKDKWNPKL